MARSATAAALNLRHLRRLSIVAPMTPTPGPCIVHKRGADILHDPWFNKVSYCDNRTVNEKMLYIMCVCVYCVLLFVLLIPEVGFGVLLGFEV